MNGAAHGKEWFTSEGRHRSLTPPATGYGTWR